MAASANIKRLVNEITNIAANDLKDGASLPEGSRRALQAATKQLGFALERPNETLVRVTSGPIYVAAIRTAIDLKVFEYLIEAGLNGMTSEDLVQRTRTDKIVLPRLLRILVVVGLLSQDKDRWVATPLAQTFVIPPLRSGLTFLYDLVNPALHKMPEFFRTQNRNPTSLDGPFQLAWNTNLSGFDFVMAGPEHAETLKDINLFMEGRRQMTASWLDFYPLQDRIINGCDTSPGSGTVVDVGGGLGHGLIEIRNRFPKIPGRLILQDLPKTLQQAGDPKGVFEVMPHSFYDPQPIQGARVYYLRQVLHDWPDKDCRTILEQLRAVMRRGYSKILLNELIVPENTISDFISTCDLVMMAMSGGMERTKRQWEQLVESVGLRVEKIWTLDEETESVLEVVLE